ncbi:hypothetical protein LCGC14_0387280 [marine sediment metagenome]|uniref:Uncharacterized protein n=1 Tax=marine sediment metagenome TaxID=412755 RepID=A0A0F9T0T2_9ZZZZ
MTYSKPRQWSHGDIPTAAIMNKYSDSLNAINASLSAVNMPAQLWSYENYDGTNFANSDYYMVHRYRYLIYRGNGEITDPSGVGDTVNVTGSGSSILTYDLKEISWLTPGKLYLPKDFVFCLEDKIP